MAEQTIAEYLAEADAAPPDLLARSRILYTIHELSRLISTKFDNAMVRHKLTHGQWWALVHIHAHQGASQSDLAAIMGMTRASAGKLFERMEAKGWIERRDDAHDSRIRRIHLADGVVPVFRLMAVAGNKMYDDLLGTLNEQEAAALLEGLTQIQRNAQASLGK